MNPGRFLRCAVALVFWLAADRGLAQPAAPATQGLQFDLFPGYGGVMAEAAWLPMTFELKNDLSSYLGVIQLTPSTFGGNQDRRAAVELPSGALKRVTVPVFCSARYQNWGAALFDERGRRRGEALNIFAVQGQSRVVSWKARLTGAIPRAIGGTPAPAPITAPPDLQPACVRLNPVLLPDNPLLLERLDVLYLNSEKAIELREPQVRALLTWLHAGGHLIVGVETLADVNALPWLRNIFPMTLTGERAETSHRDLHGWLSSPALLVNASEAQNLSSDQMAAVFRRRYGIDRTPAPAISPAAPAVPAAPAAAPLTEDAAFERAPLLVATGQLRGGRVVAGTKTTPFIVTGDIDRGRVTALLFSPEREPAKSWRHLPVLWSRLLEITPPSAQNSYEPGSDGIFGAMVDSRQIHKMPVEWLLVLLVAYLLVIGPLDRWWLKKIGRPMLTWITFPCYVVFFSLLIYFIGHKLRAGESEWNELHVVDVFANGDRAELRGRTYASVYSPISQRYPLTNSAKFAVLRGEFQGSYSADKTELRVNQSGDSFQAEMTVPVWVNQMCVSDWWQGAPLPVSLQAGRTNGEPVFTAHNLTKRSLTQARVVFGDQIYNLGELGAGEQKTFRASQTPHEPVGNWLMNIGNRFLTVVQQRQATFGDRMSGRLENLPEAGTTASFLSLLSGTIGNTRFVETPGLDLTPVVARGQAVLLAWTPNYSPIQPLNQFTPRRTQRNTLWRVSASVPP